MPKTLITKRNIVVLIVKKIIKMPYSNVIGQILLKAIYCLKSEQNYLNPFGLRRNDLS